MELAGVENTIIITNDAMIADRERIITTTMKVR